MPNWSTTAWGVGPAQTTAGVGVQGVTLDPSVLVIPGLIFTAEATASAPPPESSKPCATGASGWSWGGNGGVVVGAGLGPNYSIGAAATGGVGNFHGGQKMGIGGYGSAGAFSTSTGSFGNYPPNNTSIPNFTIGAMAGKGPGMFFANTGNPSTLAGPFTSVILAVPAIGWFPGVQIEYDFSGSTKVVSLSPGNIGAGLMVLQTNTFATFGGPSGCGKP